jgi:hypothetical protein
MIYSSLMSNKAIIAKYIIRIEYVIRVRFNISSKSKARVIINRFSSFILI